MNQEIKTKWCSALRSGEYQQGRGQLKTKDNKYCCLGVLAVVTGLTIAKNGIDLQEDEGSKEESIYPSISKIIDNKEEINRLYVMNDSRKSSFKEIADYIEKNL